LHAALLEALKLATDTVDDIEIEYHYDLPSFFAFYRIINAKSLAEGIGMHQSLLAQYISGLKKPSKKQVKRIIRGVHEIGHELSETNIIINT
jgi:DNA-binding transcriptional regulator YdaS (Cro superfamily)